MSDSEFDPYHKWLGIPAEHQPPTHYRLLGIELFESDPDVIESAAMRQMSHVRSFAIGQHGAATQSLLNQIAEAKLCLLTSERKKAYDGTLRERRTPSDTIPTLPCPTCTSALAVSEELHGKLVKCPKCDAHCQISDDGKTATEITVSTATKDSSPFDSLPKPHTQPPAGNSTEFSVRKPTTRKAGRKRKKKFLNWITLVAVPTGAICGVSLAIVLLWVLFQKDPLGIMVAENSSKNTLIKIPTVTSRTTEGQGKSSATESNTRQQASSTTLQRPTGPAPSLAIAPFNAQKAKEHQQAWANHLGVAVETKNSIGMTFALIPPGSGPNGSHAFAENERPAHEVQIDTPFQLGVCEVTQEQYAKVMGNNPSHLKASSHPVENVSWSEAVLFCEKLSSLPAEQSSGYAYRLPEESEWEYACRAGTTSDYSFSEDLDRLPDFAWLKDNSEGRSHPVGQKTANPWNLKDMHGNVWEWCLTGFHPYAEMPSQTPDLQRNTNPIRIQRGAGWHASADMARSAFRGKALINYRGKDHGFRVLRFKRMPLSQRSESTATAGNQPASIDLLKRISAEPSAIHKDWHRKSDGTFSANVHANHDVLKIPVPEISSLESYGLVVEFGNNGRRTGKPRFSIKVPYNDSKRIRAGYYYGATYNMSVALEDAGTVGTRRFLGYHSLALNVNKKYIDVSINGQSLGRITHERGKLPAADECVLELSGISGSWMHFHLKSVHLLTESSTGNKNETP